MPYFEKKDLMSSDVFSLHKSRLPNICGLSVWNILHVTLLSLRISGGSRFVENLWTSGVYKNFRLLQSYLET